MKKITAVLVLLICALLCAVSAGALTEEEIQEKIDAGASPEYIVAFHQSGRTFDYSKCVDELQNGANSETKITQEKYMLSLLAANEEVNAQISAADSDGIMAVVYALHLVNNGCAGDAQALVSYLCSMQLADGGWALFGETSDADVTAMVLSALACSDVNSDTIDKALDFLSTAQQESGGFKSFGEENAESAAQVIIALSSLNVDLEHDERFIKNGRTVLDALKEYELADGDYCHIIGGERSESASVQAYSALVAVQRNAPFYLLDKQTKMVRPKADKKLIIGIIIGILCIISCVFVWIKKKKIKSVIFTFALFAVIFVVAMTTNIQSTESYYGTAEEKETVGKVSVSIRCDRIMSGSDAIILSETDIEFAENDSVYDVLVAAARENRILLDASGTGDFVYIAGINNIAEFDYGELSGWMFRVNGDSASLGCGEYKVHNGDKIEWVYTLESGKDID